MIGKKTIWTEDDIDFIKQNHSKMTNVMLANELNKTLTVVRNKCHELGLKHMEMEYWTEEQTGFLKKYYTLMGDVEMAELFNMVYPKNKPWTNKHIDKKRGYLGLKRTTAELAAIKERNKDQGRFSINHWKRWVIHAPEGETRVWQQHGRPYKVVKTEGIWVHYAPWLYVQHFGEIPPDHVVSFKDYNQLNVVPENLIAIHKSQLRARNALWKYPPDLRESLKAAAQLNKKLIEIRQNQNGKKQIRRPEESLLPDAGRANQRRTPRANAGNPAESKGGK